MALSKCICPKAARPSPSEKHSMNIDLGKVRVLAPGINEADINEALRRHAQGKWGKIPLSCLIRNLRYRRKRGPVGSRHTDRNGVEFLIETLDGETLVCPMKL